jgi:hypothetical protein
VAKIKSERHHWWPECVSEYWADAEGGVHWLSPDGTVRRSTPNNFGVIGNGHSIKMGSGSSPESWWDSSFEAEFQNADSSFPRLIEWLSTLDHCSPPFDRPLESRIMAQPVTDEQFRMLFECIVSLAARSPMHRERAVGLAENLREPLAERERNALIGYNIRYALRNAMRNFSNYGKAMVIYSPEREFIFGDGFFHNLTTQGEHWYNPQILVPLTPWMSVLFAKPITFGSEPRLMTVVTSADETSILNDVIQVYSRNMIFYRSEKPMIREEFMSGKHMIFRDHVNPVSELIHKIPGIPPRDTALDDFFEILRRRK